MSEYESVAQCVRLKAGLSLREDDYSYLISEPRLSVDDYTDLWFELVFHDTFNQRDMVVHLKSLLRNDG